MARRGTAIPSSFHQEQSWTWLDERLARACQNLLERPLDCRGPFIISDRELRADRKTTRPFKLAAISMSKA
jgi:hypothetical protein